MPMKQDYLKYYKSNFLIFLIGALLALVFLAKNNWGLSISLFSTVSFILVIITKYFWRYKPFIWLFNIDDFSGRYEGVLKYQYRNDNCEIVNGELKHVKLVNQTGSRITVSSFSIKTDGGNSSLSVNKGMYVEKTEDEQHYRLIYNYLNGGSSSQDFPPHYGTEVVKFIKKGNTKVLSGGYYTDRSPFQTKGEFFELNWVSDDLDHEF